MRAKAEESFTYCSALVRRRDEDRWLAAHYAPAHTRQRLLALYALHLEIETIPHLVSEAALGEIRLQWWRETIAEIDDGKARAHPVAQAVLASEIVDKIVRQGIERAIDARARLLYAEPFATYDELAQFLARADAYLGRLAARILVPSISKANVATLERAALANALAKHGAALAPALKDEIRRETEKLYRNCASAVGDWPASVMPAAAHFALTRGYLRNDFTPSPIGRRLRVFAAVATGRI